MGTSERGYIPKKTSAAICLLALAFTAQAAVKDVNNVRFRGDSGLMGMSIKAVYATDGAFLVETEGARYEYVPGSLKIYQGVSTSKRLLATIAFDSNSLFEKVENTSGYALFWSERFNIGIFGDSTCIVGAKQSGTLALKNNFEPALHKVSDERAVLSDILGGLSISPQLNGSSFWMREKGEDLQIKFASEQVMILRTFSAISDKALLLSNTKNPQAVKEVMGGKRTVANAAWWGFDSNDATDALQAAINSGAKKVVIPSMGSDWIVKPIFLKSNQEIYFEPGAVVAAKEGYFKGERECLFTILKQQNITLSGYGATLKMRKKDYAGRGYKKAEWRHVILFRGSANIKVLGLKLASSGGDGICIGSTQWKDYSPCRGILIRDCNFDDNYRQGISVGSVNTLRVENCIFRNTSGTPPSGGIDFEPDDNREMLSNIVVSNCVSEDNRGEGFLVGITNLDAKSREVSILFINCYAKACNAPGLAVFGSKENNPRGLIEFRDCVCEKTVFPGIRVETSTSSALKIKFVNCILNEVATNQYQSPIRLNLNLKTLPSKIEFENCSVYDNKNRPFLTIRNIIPGNNPYDIKGDINVYNDYGAKVDSQSPLNSPSLEIKSHKNK